MGAGVPVSLAFTVEGRPVPKGRPRFGNGHAYTPAKTRAYENAVQWAAAAQLAGKPCPAFPTGDVKLTITAYLFGKARPDIDNVVKAISDALNSIAYTDDRQVAWIDARRIACKRIEQRVEVRIEMLNAAPDAVIAEIVETLEVA